MVYDKTGGSLSAIYNKDGEFLAKAYDINGDQVFSGIVPNFKVMTYNVQYFSGINGQQTMQLSIFDKYDADIIGLQELGANGMPAVGAACLTEYPYKYIGVQTNKTALVSKTALSNVSAAVFSHQLSEQRGYQKGYVTVAGKSVCWVNTHLENASSAVKYQQAVEIASLVRNEEYAIITGDFNSTCLDTSDADYVNIYKPFIDGGYKVANCSAAAGFTKTWTSSAVAKSTAEMTEPTDSIIVTGNIDIVAVTFDPTKFSHLNGQSIDHIPVIAYLRIT